MRKKIIICNFVALLLFAFAVKSDDEFKLDLNALKGKSLATCVGCELLMGTLLTFLRSNITEEQARAALQLTCQITIGASWNACKGMVHNEFATIWFIARNNPNLTGKRVCAIHKQTMGCTDDTIKDWSIKIQPKNTKNIVNNNKVYAKSEPLNILHLTDVHFDNLYTPGSNSKCGKPLCCQNDSGAPTSPKNAAGYWGDYNVCDIPLHTVQASLDHILKEHKKIDLIYYTGDVISHIGWKTSREINTHDFMQLNKLFKDTFGDIPIYSVLGNHEAYPQDFYSAESVKNIKELSTQWVYDIADEAWSAWLPKSTSSTIKRGGFYSVLVKPKFRVIGLNSNVCYFDNKWLLYDDVDPYGQLQWLADTLQEAEDNGESVHILSHIPPGSKECYKIWNREFVKIVKRYSETIKAQFNGHSHEDEWRVFFDDEDPKKVVNVAFNGASLTTFVGMNPNYKMFEVNPETMDVIDYHTWIFNMTEANLSPNQPPRFYKLYSFVEDYKLGSLTKENLGKAVANIENDVEMQKQYWRFRVRESDRKLNGCSGWCLSSTACFIRSVYVEDTLKC